MLAAAIRGEPENDRPKGSQSWLQKYQASISSGTDDSLNASTLWNLWNEAASVGSQRIREDIGIDTFAQTIAKTAAAAACRAKEL